MSASHSAKPRTFRRSESWYFDDAPGLLVDVIAQLNEYLDRAGPLYRDKVEFEVESDYYSGHAGHATIGYTYTETQEEADARAAEEQRAAEIGRAKRAAAKLCAAERERLEYERLRKKYESK